MKTLDECATLEELVMSRRSCAAIPVANEAALQRAAELGRQQGWNEAIEAAVQYHQIEIELLQLDGLGRENFWEIARHEQYIHGIRALKMPTQEKAEG